MKPLIFFEVHLLCGAAELPGGAVKTTTILMTDIKHNHTTKRRLQWGATGKGQGAGCFSGKREAGGAEC